MPMMNKPSYPIVDPNPSLGKCLINFHASDYLSVAGFAYAGYLFGFFGARKPFRVHNSGFLFGVGLVAGLMYGIQNSTYRLVGLRQNDSEVKAYGIASEESIAENTARGHMPNIELIKALK